MSATKPMRRCFRSGTSARSARIPPSPWLSARMTKARYFTVTTIVSAHTMSEHTPSTSPASGCIPGSGAMPTWSV